MTAFGDYANKYRFIRMERRDGILQMTLHTDGGPLRWRLEAQAECARALSDVGADRDNRIVILTGTGEEFSGPRLDPDAPAPRIIGLYERGPDAVPVRFGGSS